MDTQRGQQMFDDNDDPGVYGRRQKARGRMRRIRLDRKAQIASRRELVAKNLSLARFFSNALIVQAVRRDNVT
jgi:hypothetical protein